MRRLAALALLPLIAAAQAPTPAKPKTPSEIVAAAPKADWREIAADDLLVFELQGGKKVVMQLAPDFAPVHVANIRALAKGGWWDGAAIYRVQDNYVVQWGNNESEKPFPAGVVAKPPAEYAPAAGGPRRSRRWARPMPMPHAPASRAAGRSRSTIKEALANLAHCYAMVGVGRGLSPDTGTGGELYAVIGHAPRHLDRNIALVGRIVQGLEHMSARCRAAPRRWASTRSARRTCRSSAPGWRPTCPPPSGRGSNISPAPRSPPICTHEKTGRTIFSFVLPAGQICAMSTCR